jgi:hypothetical protein
MNIDFGTNISSTIMPPMLPQQADDIKAKLLSQLFLQPSSDWLKACVAYLQRKNQSLTVDSVLYQVLYSDLRAVVRTLSDGDDGGIRISTQHHHNSIRSGLQTVGAGSVLGDSTNTLPHPILPYPAVQLHQAINKSSQATCQYKQILPQTFGLLCQLEMLEDVSLNADRRLEVGPVNKNSNNPTPFVGNQSSRCLKLHMTHGYYFHCRDNNVNNNKNSQHGVFVGTETTPIPNLSSHSLAGMKILLKGPLEIRHRVLLLHPGNCFVLGGGVEELVDYQHKALQRARESAGVGVDPTIRALVRTSTDPLLQDQDEDGDEGDEASGDIVTRRQQVYHHDQQQNQQQQFPPMGRPQQQPPPSSLVGEVVLGGRNSNMSRSSIVVTTLTATNQQSSTPSLSSPTGTQSSFATRVVRPTLPTTNTIPSSNVHGSVNGTKLDQRMSPSGTIQGHQPTNPPGPSPEINPYESGSSHHPSTSTSLPASHNTDRIPRTFNATIPTSTTTAPTSANPYLRAGPLASTLSSFDSHGVNSNSDRQPRMVTAAFSTAMGPVAVDIDRCDTMSLQPVSAPNPNAPSSLRDDVATVHLQQQQQRHARSIDTTLARVVIPESPMTMHSTGKNNVQSNTAHQSTPHDNDMVQNMTFSSLRQLLLQAVSSREIYESCFQRKLIFRLRLCKKIGVNSIAFNVAKVKSKGGSSKDRKSCVKKYEYFISCAFADPDIQVTTSSTDSVDDDNIIVCKLHTDLLGPLFEVSAGELRSMSRANREECTRITDEGGTRVQDSYFSARYWQASLYLTPEEIFGINEQSRTITNTTSLLQQKAPKELLMDLKTPILLLDRPDTFLSPFR